MALSRNDVEGHASMSFLRHRGIYQSDELKRRAQSRLSRNHARAHRLDEFPVGYSWRVALQQSPLPLHQPPLILRELCGQKQELFSLWTKPWCECKTFFSLVPGGHSHMAGFEVTTEGKNFVASFELRRSNGQRTAARV